ncbi:TetR/AcrR family transcriptional regulator [Pontibacter sp. SGAir0037]|uniref:TetR/AcrR family transcriptional regulator n=1 Tax=Pontibacter sp. SGAir0037 TaxID=2571030 RepID=UPI0010CD2A9D|nr:TetR/AcrR family transcriptional regulator [Pontibacter sp. SGAir0037]QCR23654.1 TetR family transcriptional regulator [Pontibacter sp. SGAir0037]
MTHSITINLSHKSYLREPESTELGRKIISESIKLIDTLGFEQFTFKKLAAEIGSTEASVYRYFENKHKLLVYLVSWYWAWVDFNVSYETHNISDPREQLSKALDVVAAANINDPRTPHIDEKVLNRIVIAEASKVYLTKEVDHDNQEGFFYEYKQLCHRLAKMVQEINPEYAYPNALISTLLEAAHHQLYFAEHLPSLTELKGKQLAQTEASKFLRHLVFAAINPTMQLN